MERPSYLPPQRYPIRVGHHMEWYDAAGRHFVYDTPTIWPADATTWDTAPITREEKFFIEWKMRSARWDRLSFESHNFFHKHVWATPRAIQLTYQLEQ